MVCWIKKTATITASVFLGLANPIVQPSPGQDAIEKATVETVSENAIAPEVPLVPSDESVAESVENVSPANNPSATDVEPPPELESAIESAAKTEPKETTPVPTDEPQPSRADDSTSDLEVSEPIKSADAAPARATDEAPAIVIRPPAEGSGLLNGCTMEVKKIGDADNQEFAIWLHVPDSVKVIEVLPSQSVDSARNFRLRLDKGPESDHPGDSQPKTQATSVSSGQEVPARLENLNMQFSTPSIPQLRSLPAAQPEFYGRQGFQQNPYFKRGSTKKKNATARQSVRPFQQLPVQTPRILPQSHRTVQAVYRPSSEVNEPVAPTAQYTGDATKLAQTLPRVPEIVTAKPSLNTRLVGPQEMKLGETGHFVILVSNQIDTVVNDAKFKLNLPEGLDVVLLDREAQIDRANRTITWCLPPLSSGEEVFIRYRVQATMVGVNRQQMGVTVEDQFEYDGGINTRVIRGLSPETARARDYESK